MNGPARGGLALLCGAALVTTGCQDGAEPVGGTVELSMTYQAANTAESPYEALAAAYMAEHEGVEISLNPQPNDSYPTTLRTQLQAGSAPDLIQTSPGRGQGNSAIDLAEAGFLAPLGDASAAVVPEGSEDLFGFDGGVYGQPMDLTVTGVVFSATAADAAGVVYPADMDALLAGCADLAAAGTSMFAVAGAAPPNTGMMAMSISASRVYAAEPDWNAKRAGGEVSFAESDGWRDTLQAIVDMHESGCFQGGVEGSGFDAITTGLSSGSSLAAFVPAAAALELERAAEGSELEVRAFPVAEEDLYLLASANYSLSINADSAEADAAQEFLDWVAEPEQAALFADASGALPVTGMADAGLSDTIYEPVADLLTTGAYAPLPNNLWPNPGVYEALGAGVQGLLTGQGSVDDVLASMDAAWEG